MKNVSTDELHVGVGVGAWVRGWLYLTYNMHDSSYFLHYITLWIDHIAHLHRLSFALQMEIIWLLSLSAVRCPVINKQTAITVYNK